MSSRLISRFLLCLPVLTVVGLMLAGLLTAGCAQKEYHYWQKSDPTTAIYLTGPKAQAMLEQDIAGCVHEIIELDKLETVRENGGKAPLLADNLSQKAEAESLSKLPGYDVPDYIRSLRVEHKDFHDFDGCMHFKGWERVKYVSPETEVRAHEIYNWTGDYQRPAVQKPVRQTPSDGMQREQDELSRR
jgi:hypothetical protein